jgi:hypothetical protein
MNSEIAEKYKTFLTAMLILLAGLPACTGVNTFPVTARAGDTISVMAGGSENARKETVDVTLQDINGQVWDLKALGLVRSLFNLRMDGRANGLHYSSYLDSDISWNFGHEPVQTVLVTNLPANVAPGTATLTVSLNAVDNSSGIADPFSVNLEIVPGSGSPDQFLRQDSLSGTSKPAQLGKLEPAPHAKITFGGSSAIGAASLKISFNSAVLDGNNINVYTPESTVRGDFMSLGAFGKTQRMVYWRQDGQNLYVDIVAPQGIAGKYLQLFVIHPKGLSDSPGFVLTDAKVYGVDGSLISGQPTLQYFP